MANSWESHSWFQFDDTPTVVRRPILNGTLRTVYDGLVTWVDSGAGLRVTAIRSNQFPLCSFAPQLQAMIPGATVRTYFAVSGSLINLNPGSPDPPGTVTCP